MGPLFTIIIPTYNSAKYIDKMMGSLYRQTKQCFEIIVCDGNSDDKTMNKLVCWKKSFAAQSISLEVLVEPIRGPARQINKALPLVKTPYFLCADSDDWYDVNLIEVLSQYISDVGCFDLGFIGVAFHREDYSEMFRLNYSPTESTNYLERYIFADRVICFTGINVYNTASFDIAHPARHLFENPHGQNWQLLLPMLKAYQPTIIPNVYYHYLVRNGSISSRDGDFEKKKEVSENHMAILEAVLREIGLYDVYGPKAIDQRRAQLCHLCYEFSQRKAFNANYNALSNPSKKLLRKQHLAINFPKCYSLYRILRSRQKAANSS